MRQFTHIPGQSPGLQLVTLLTAVQTRHVRTLLKLRSFCFLTTVFFFSSFTHKNKVASHDVVSCYCRLRLHGVGICARVWNKVCFKATDSFKPTISPAKLLQSSEPPQLSSSTTVSVRRLQVAWCKMHTWIWRYQGLFRLINSARVSSHENKQISQNRFLGFYFDVQNNKIQVKNIKIHFTCSSEMFLQCNSKASCLFQWVISPIMNKVLASVSFSSWLKHT